MPYLNFLLPTFLAFTVSAISIFYIKKLAFKLGAVDRPGGRRIHKKATPRMGGVAIAIGFFAVLALFVFAFPDYLSDHLIDLKQFHNKSIGFIVGALIILLVGIYDDIKNLKPAPKFILQLVAILIAVASGISIYTIGNPFDSNNLISLGNLGYFIAPIWLIFMINAINWFDGADGLSGGVSTIAAITIGVLSLQSEINQPEIAFLAFLLAGATLGFMPFNWHPAKIFLGDSGSMFLGFTLGTLAILSGAKLATTALVLGLPLFDAIWVIARRIYNKKPPWKADSLHLHHRFLRAGFTPPMIAILNYLIAITLGIIAVGIGTTVDMEKIIIFPIITGFLTGILFAYFKKITRTK